jgi:RND family efflux transporter MFP subunit
MAVAAALALASAPGAEGLPDADGVEAITRPSEDVTMSFVRPGWIAKVLVKPGDVVRKGQLLIQMDDRAEQVQFKKLQAQADDTTRKRAAQAKLNLANFMVTQTKWAHKRGAATKLEVQEKELEAKISELSLELAKFEHGQSQLERDSAAEQLKRMQLRSPVDGVVEQVVIEEGESAEANQPLIQIVKTDPLWVDVPVPAGQVRALKLAVNDPAMVRHPCGDGEKPPAEVVGRILYLARVVEAGSTTRNVRVELPNVAGRPAGEHVKIKFLEPSRLVRSAGEEPAVEDRNPVVITKE